MGLRMSQLVIICLFLAISNALIAPSSIAPRSRIKTHNLQRPRHTTNPVISTPTPPPTTLYQTSDNENNIATPPRPIDPIEEDETTLTSATTSAKDMLSKYGVAYLATSIPLAAISFGTFYALVSAGLPVAELLSTFNIAANSNSEVSVLARRKD